VTDWEVVRQLAPEVLGTLVRRHGHFDACEDAVQEALVAAATQWPIEGWPDSPRGWLITVASRRLTDQVRSDAARRRREEAEMTRALPSRTVGTVPGDADAGAAWSGDTLTLLVLCCHPALSPASQVALTLRAVGGLSTAEIARAFLVPEPTMAQRISRAKQRIQATGATFEPPTPADRDERLAAVLRVLYLIFNEGYTATSGTRLVRADLTAEAIRLTREIHPLVPDDGEVAGLLALMLLTDARRPARTAPDGSLIPLDEQDRTRWDADAIAEGVALVTDALAHGPVGPYQLQAAIAAVHDEAPTADATDWRQILALYSLLEQIAPNPMTTLNRAVALAMVEGPASGLALLERLSVDDRAAASHHLTSVRAHLLELAGDHDGALAGYREAARRTTSEPERRHLLGRAARLSHRYAGC
jgi:RNA polymerase sigma factor (sigma-70 family)